MSLYEYVKSSPIINVDSKGTQAAYTHEGCEEAFNKATSKYMKAIAQCGLESGMSFGTDTLVCLGGCGAIGVGTGAGGAKICLEACGGLTTLVNLGVFGACASAAAIDKEVALQAKEYCHCRSDGGCPLDCQNQAQEKHPDPDVPWWVDIFVW